MAVIREELQFTGRVQGVGFRYTCASLARNFGVTGWVRNERDGSVLGEFQGEPEALAALIAELKQGRFIIVTGLQRRQQELDESEQEFQITG